MIYSNRNENRFIVDLSEHVKGVYFVKSYSDNEMMSTTLIRF